MANYWNQMLIFWQDSNGGIATSFVTIQNQSDAVPAPLVTLAAASQALSDARIVACQFQTTHYTPGAPTTGPYDTVSDRAIFGTTYAEGGANSRIEIPAPKSAIFLADNRTVDMSNPLVETWMGEVVNVVGNRNSSPVALIKPGVRQRINS